MADGEFGGDPWALSRAGEDYKRTGGDARTSVTTRQVSLTVPGGTNSVWASGSAATAATTGWQTYLTGLAGQFEEYGDNLITAAKDYRETDRRAMKGDR
jgi:hypothetical protein